MIDVIRTAGGHRRILMSEALRFIQKKNMRILRPDLLGLADLQDLSPTALIGDLKGESLLQVLESDDADKARGLIVSAFLAGRSPAELLTDP